MKINIKNPNRNSIIPRVITFVVESTLSCDWKYKDGCELLWVSVLMFLLHLNIFTIGLIFVEVSYCLIVEDTSLQMTQWLLDGYVCSFGAAVGIALAGATYLIYLIITSWVVLSFISGYSIFCLISYLLRNSSWNLNGEPWDKDSSIYFTGANLIAFISLSCFYKLKKLLPTITCEEEQ